MLTTDTDLLSVIVVVVVVVVVGVPQSYVQQTCNSVAWQAGGRTCASAHVQ